MRAKQLVCLLLALLTICLFAGCKKGGGDNNGVDPSTLPDIDRTEKVKLTIWSPLEQWAADSPYDKNEPFQKIAEELNLELEFIHPAVGQEADQFNLMITDKKLPDIIFCGNWYSGNVQTGVQHGIYKNLNGYAEKYAPDYVARINSLPDVKREVLMDGGAIGAIYGFAEYEEWCYSGPIFNKKALDQVNEPVPVTIDDWTRVLGKFKNELNMNSAFGIHPLGLQYLEQAIVSAYGAASGFIQDPATQTAMYGPMRNGYIDYLNLIRSWYDAGYIAADFDSRDWAKNVDSFKNLKCGVFFDNPANAATLLGTYGEDWIEAPYPVLREGDRLNLRLKNWYAQSNNGAWNTCAVVTRDCGNIARAVDFLNYGFTEKGILLFNYGTEGKTYVIDEETGKPKFTDYLFDNPEGLDIYNALYRFKNHNGVFVRQEKTSNPIVQKNPVGMEIMAKWTDGADAGALIPPITYTMSEQRVIDLYFADIEQYVIEQQMAFITGQKNDISATAVGGYDSVFKRTLENMGIRDILEVVQSAFNRYLERVE